MLYCLINSVNLADSEAKFRGLADETWYRTLVAGQYIWTTNIHEYQGLTYLCCSWKLSIFALHLKFHIVQVAS
jgi:hypothetical protein